MKSSPRTADPLRTSSLRLFSPTDESPDSLQTRQRELDQVTGVSSAKRVDVALADFAPVIADAVASGRGWLTDFATDTVSIDADLYEVLLAYQQMRRLNVA